MPLTALVLLLTADEAARLLDRFHAEPSVAELCAAAEGAAMADPARARSWMWRARAAPWLPQVLVRFDRGVQYDTSTDDGADGVERSVDTDDDTGWRVQASWELSRLLFEPNELGVAREGSNLVELRARVLQEVVRLYYERRRLQVETLLAPETPDERALVREARIREIEASLDVLTGGAMTRELRRARAPAAPTAPEAPVPTAPARTSPPDRVDHSK